MPKWKAPDGYVLSKHEGCHLNAKGFLADEGDELMPDGQLMVAWPNDDEPFTAATHPSGMVGYSPSVMLKPIKDGYVPPVYMLHLAEEAPDV